MPQTLSLRFEALSAALQPVAVLSVGDTLEFAGQAKTLWTQTGLKLKNIAEPAGFKGKQGQVLDLLALSKAPKNVSRILVTGTGAANGSASGAVTLHDRGGSLIGKLAATGANGFSVILDEMSADEVADVALGIHLKHYRFDKYKSPKPSDESPSELTVVLHADDPLKAEKAFQARQAVAAGVYLARDLVNEPPNVLGPLEFADIARGLTEFGVDVDVLTPEEMRKLGMGALLAVAQGSARPARLVVMQWHGGKKGEAPVALVGKGVVFDTGGISIKPAGSMEDMKGDMGGAAAVAGTMRALAQRKAKANVVGVIGLVENMPDGNAYRPGDILKAMNGKTIEVVNTDAEGRLVLADALWYTRERFKPSAIVDLATLTGAIMVALGQDYAGLFSNNDDLAGQLLNAGQGTGEKLWRMPLGPAYEKMIESRFADIKNTGGRYGGSSTAAQFLQHFVGDTPWVHLDIAGTAFGAPGHETNGSWGSGFGVKLLNHWIASQFESGKKYK